MSENMISRLITIAVLFAAMGQIGNAHAKKECGPIRVGGHGHCEEEKDIGDMRKVSIDSNGHQQRAPNQDDIDSRLGRPGMMGPEDAMAVAFQEASHGILDDAVIQQEFGRILATGNMYEEEEEILTGAIGKSALEAFREKKGGHVMTGGIKGGPWKSTKGHSRGRNKRFALYTERTWEKGLIPYTFSDVISESDTSIQLIRKQLHYLERISCVRFHEYYPGIHAALGLPHTVSLNFVNDPSEPGCWSYIGRLNPSVHDDWFQRISTCGAAATSHEVFHAVGSRHTQERSDSKTMLQVNVNNIDPSNLQSFVNEDTDNHIVHFGFDSIMQYSSTAFAINGNIPTWMTYDVDLQRLNDAREGYVIQVDVEGLNSLYHCAAQHCSSFPHTCQNKGFVGFIDGACKCVCPRGLTGDTCEQRYVTQTTSWPDGEFTLPMSVEGCPGTDFATGTHVQSCAASIYVLTGGNLHLPAGSAKKHFTHHFCSHGAAQSTGTAWPSGTYCIYRKGGSCPVGFIEGYLDFDDSDDDNRNEQRGTLPDGVFGSDTLFYYCCRSDGALEDPIILPSAEPFQLLLGEYKQACQEVQDMIPSRGYYYIVSENTTFGEPYPYFVEGWRNRYNLHRYTFCHYTPAPVDDSCSDILDVTPGNPLTVVSSVTPSGNFRRCNWVVKSPPGTVLNIDFSNFNIPTGAGGVCGDDFVEIRHHRLTSQGDKYCGYRFPNTMISYEREVMLKQQISPAGSGTATFTATFTVVQAADYAYDVTLGGKTYGGKVGYTQKYQPCMAWDDVPQCAFNLYNSPKLLGAQNYCRNPTEGLRPWCYINSDCFTDVCDVSGIGTCTDNSANCASFVAANSDYCVQPEAFEQCHLTCGYCGAGQADKASDCGPAPTIQGAYILGPQQPMYYEGDTVTYRCNNGGTQIRTCLSHGTFSGTDVMCSGCPDGYVEGVPSKCYKLFTDWKLYEDALATCQADGGSLARPATPQEQAGVETTLPTLHNSDRYIVGMTRSTTTSLDDFHWIDGTPVTWTNWAPSSHISTGQYMGLTYIGKSGGYEWDDISAHVKTFQFICEIELIPTMQCPVSGYTLKDGRCYKVSTQENTQPNAQIACQSDGAQLARVFSATEQDAIVSLLPGSGSYWIGLFQGVWPDGTTPENAGYVNWGNDRPKKDCTVEKYRNNLDTYKWEDERCSKEHYYVCGMDAVGLVCKDRITDCTALLQKHPDLCTDQEDFCRRVCRDTCNFC